MPGISLVPKIIHQTWKDRHLPAPVDHCVDTVKSLNPDWQWDLYTDPEMDAVMYALEHAPGEFLRPTLAEFRGIPTGIEKSDVFRCALLYLHGGIYCDVDIEAIRPFTDLIAAAVHSGLFEEAEVLLTTDHPLHCGRLYGREVFMNHFMIARPGAILFERYFAAVASSIRSGAMGGDPIKTTGPLVLTRLIDEQGGPLAARVGIMPYEWIHPLPDMRWDFPEVAEYDEMIRSHTWRERFNSFAAHYWWHSYCPAESIFGIYGNEIFQADGVGPPRSQPSRRGGPEPATRRGRTWHLTVPKSAPTRYPRNIWQTCASVDALPEDYHSNRDSWIALNPEWTLHLLDDQAIRDWFAEHLPGLLPIFDSFPVGVMKADLWRYAVLYVHGGIYCDTDTICTEPVTSWLPEDSSGGVCFCCEEGTPFFCQWTIASPPGHELLRRVIDLAIDRIEADGGFDLEREEPVHYYTGPEIWTAAIKEYLGTTRSHTEIQADRHFARHTGLTIFPVNFFRSGPVWHDFASFHWGQIGGYRSWRDQVVDRRAEAFAGRLEELQELLTPRILSTVRRYGPEQENGYRFCDNVLGSTPMALAIGPDDSFEPEMRRQDKEPVVISDFHFREVSLDQILEAMGAVAPANGSPPRKVFGVSAKIHLGGEECRLLGDCSLAALLTCEQIAVEFHWLHDIRHADFARSGGKWNYQINMLKRLLETHELVHVDGGEYGVKSREVPERTRCLFVSRSMIPPHPDRGDPPLTTAQAGKMQSASSFPTRHKPHEDRHHLPLDS